ncbi:MAG: ribosomal protein L7/L12 [Anaerolineae bacterium]|nr:ribosomal protein L7/L12 [Anaerolineae bacterium]
MPERFDCPSCGAPLDVPEDAGATIRCPYCAVSVVVPEALREDRDGGGQVIKIDLRGLNNTTPVIVSQSALNLGPDDPILQALREDKKIEAIKLYRERTGLGLKEAKDAVEALQAGLSAAGQAYTPTATPATARRSGCGLFLILVLVIVLIGGAATIAGILFTASAVENAVTVVQDEVIPVVATLAPTPTPGPVTLVRSVGEEGEGAGKMTDARSVTQDSEGNIYVADYLPGRVQAFSASGEFISQWMLEDPDMQIYSLAALPEGRLAVVTSRAVQIRDGRSGSLLESWTDGGAFGYGDAWLMADGTLAVTVETASVNDVVFFDMQGQIVRRIDDAFTRQTGDSEMQMSVAGDLSGNIYLLGSFSRLVLKYDREGTFITRFGGEGNEPGQFTFPDDIAVDSAGRVYVSEGRNLTIFDENGRLVARTPLEGLASGMAVNNLDELLTASRDSVLIYQPVR